MAAATGETHDSETDSSEWEETAYLWHSHIWNLLQQNPFFITYGYYVFENGESWTLEELERWTNSNKEDSVKEKLQ